MRPPHRHALTFLFLTGAHFIASFPVFVPCVVLVGHPEPGILFYILTILFFFPFHLGVGVGLIQLGDSGIHDMATIIGGMAVNSLAWAVIVYALWLVAHRAYRRWRPAPLTEGDSASLERLLREWVYVPEPERPRQGAFRSGKWRDGV